MKARVLSAWVSAATVPAVLFLGAAATASPALASPPTACGPHTEVIKTLGDRFHETQSATALTSVGTLLEVLTAKDGSTWTIIVSRPDGLSCVVAAGQNWQDKAGDQAATAISF
ncbi:MAG TPA: hypothetical protein VLV76_16760 [Candidatus Acidoferrum sp.]|nr:hypothetical protein [Candidatus Acidoferrum sp.]